MIDSIQESFEKQVREQGRPIGSSENRYYLSSFAWKDTVEGVLFWGVLCVSYSMYGVYDYETLIRIYIRFNTVPNYNIPLLGIYSRYFDKEKGTLTSDGFEKLIKHIC